MLQAAYIEAKLILWVRSRRLAGKLMMSITHLALALKQQDDESSYLVVIMDDCNVLIITSMKTLHTKWHALAACQLVTSHS